jgi:hypothetical protein
MEFDFSEIITSLVALSGLVVSLVYARRMKKAEVRQKEIENDKSFIQNADDMVELVRKATREVSEVNGKFIEDLRKKIDELYGKVEKLESAVAHIDVCPYRHQCPVMDELQKQQYSVGARARKNGGENRGDNP